MKPQLPKDTRGFGFPRLIEIDLNDFAMERILSDVFYLAVSGGRNRGKSPNDAKAIATYGERLSQHPRIEGFDDPAAARMLDQWVRAAVIKTSRATRKLTGEQIDYLLPQSLAVYKAGFPDNYRQRNVPGFLYEAMISALPTEDDTDAAADLRTLFTRAFGQGVAIGDAPRYSPAYDGQTQLDIHSLLTLAYLDGFEPVLASAHRMRRPHTAALPAQATAIGRRLTRFLAAYAGTIPSAALARAFVAITNLELFVYTMKLFYATPALVRTGEIPPAMRGAPTSDPELYCDFSTSRGGESEALAKACVERDLEALSAFSYALIYLRTIEKYCGHTKAMDDELAQLGPITPEYLLRLRELANHPRVLQWAQLAWERIRDETVKVYGAEMEAAVLSQFEATRAGSATELDLVVDLLVSEQKRHIAHLTAWYQSAAGLRSTYGILAGAPRSRTSWRYAISDDLLANLVLLAHADDAGDERLSLQDFLEYLERSYGLIIDRPPRLAEDTSSRAAARENLAGMKRKLREMDFFSELSDDFAAQYLTPPTGGR